MKPGLGQAPVTFDGCGGYTHHVRRLFDGESAEVSQLNHACLLLVECRQCFERVVERDQFRASFDCAIDVFVQREFLKILPTFFCIVLARMIHQQATHYLCSDSEKMCAVLPVYSRLVYQPQVSLMHQRGRLQSVIDSLPSQIIRCKLTQFIVDDG